jgi:hypothetical protein
MSYHPPVRLARSEEFLALDCLERHIFRPLWVRGEERRWATDRVATAEDRVFWELEALGLLVGPGARRVFDGALLAFLRTGAMRREVEDLVLPILSGDVAKEQPAAATLRKRRQRERERARGAVGSRDEGEGRERDTGRDIDSVSRDEVTPGEGGADRDRPGVGGRDPSGDTPRDASRSPVPEKREEILSSSSSLPGNSGASDNDPVSDTAREGGGPSRPEVTPGVTPPVTLTEAEVFALIERGADGRIGTHPLSLRPRLVKRLADEGVTRDVLVVMVELAKARQLYLLAARDQKPGRDVVDLAVLAGSRDGDATVLGSWVAAAHREIARRTREEAQESARRRSLEAPPNIPGPVRIVAPRPLAEAAQGGGTRLSPVPYLNARRPRPGGPPAEPDGAE